MFIIYKYIYIYIYLLYHVYIFIIKCCQLIKFYLMKKFAKNGQKTNNV